MVLKAVYVVAKERDMPKRTIDELRQAFTYDPSTGAVRRRRMPDRDPTQINSRGYATVDLGAARYRVHRLAFVLMEGRWPADQVDHINRDKLDNRWGNLREATNSMNNVNRGLQANNRSGFRGVSYHKRDKVFRARVKINGVERQVGQFDNALDAAMARDKVMREHFGDFYDPIELRQLLG